MFLVSFLFFFFFYTKSYFFVCHSTKVFWAWRRFPLNTDVNIGQSRFSTAVEEVNEVHPETGT